MVKYVISVLLVKFHSSSLAVTDVDVCAVTVTVHVAYIPFVVVAVIVASPALTAVTRPLPLTLAMLSFEEVHVIFLCAASRASALPIVAVICPVSSTLRLNEVGLTSIPDGWTTSAPSTVTLHVAFFVASAFAVAVIVAVPSPAAVTFPLLSTVATLNLFDDHVTAAETTPLIFA